MEATNIDTFRKDILQPILSTIDSRELNGQIDYVVYSSDFPYSIAFGSDDPGTTDKFPAGSLTGLTFLAPLVMASKKDYKTLPNRYYREVRPDGRQIKPTRGFRTKYNWDEYGDVVPQLGMRYLLSTMLGYTNGRGNSPQEVIDYLTRSAAADYSRPQGTVYFARNENIRSTAREYAKYVRIVMQKLPTNNLPSDFDMAVRELKRLGTNGEVVQGKTPIGKQDVTGVTMGTANFTWDTARNNILPGAICEHFTSFGGVLRESAGQTPLTEFLRHGAAGASGTVIEPYAIAAKFPHPYVHVHYAQGCSLAEAFYQSLQLPYQTLIVGDPLCQPWSRPGTVSIRGIHEFQQARGTIKLTPTVSGISANSCEIYMDGKLLADIRPGQTHEIDTTTYPDGHHELRVVATEASLIETRSRKVLDFETHNHGRSVELNVSPVNGTVSSNQSIRIRAQAQNARGIAVFSNRRLLARKAGAVGEFNIPAEGLGLGPVRLSVIGLYSNDRNANVFSLPAEFNVTPPPNLPAIPLASTENMVKGVRLRVGGLTSDITDSANPNFLAKSGVAPGQNSIMSGLFQAPRSGIYQFQFALDGDGALAVDNQMFYAAKGERFSQRFVMVPLAKGWHKMTVTSKLASPGRMLVRFGDRGCRSVGAGQFLTGR